MRNIMSKTVSSRCQSYGRVRLPCDGSDDNDSRESARTGGATQRTTPSPLPHVSVYLASGFTSVTSPDRPITTRGTGLAAALRSHHHRRPGRSSNTPGIAQAHLIVKGPILSALGIHFVPAAASAVFQRPQRSPFTRPLLPRRAPPPTHTWSTFQPNDVNQNPAILPSTVARGATTT